MFAAISWLWIESNSHRGLNVARIEQPLTAATTQDWGFRSRDGSFYFWKGSDAYYWLYHWGQPRLMHAPTSFSRTPDIPYWPFALATGVLPLAHARRVQGLRSIADFSRNRRSCPVCGYDLRATPDRCPECGTETDVVIESMLRMAQRPLSVTFVAWLFIVAGTVGIAYHAREIDRNHPFERGVILALLVRLLAVVGGAFALRGRNWARWMMIGWIGFHVVLSAFHNPVEFIMHAVIAAAVAFVLFRPPASAYFCGAKVAT